MDRYNPPRHTTHFNTRLAAGAMALRANGNPGKRWCRQEPGSYLSNARARRQPR